MNFTHVTVVLVRPRSKKYAHIECMPQTGKGAVHEWRDRFRTMPIPDAEYFRCIVCDARLNQPARREK